jgi:hypothetical protein
MLEKVIKIYTLVYIFCNVRKSYYKKHNLEKKYYIDIFSCDRYFFCNVRKSY